MVIASETLYWVGNPSPELNLQTYRFVSTDDESQNGIRLSKIRTTPTGWAMGRSAQNNCEHWSISGQILKIPGSTFHPDVTYHNGGLISAGNMLFSTLIDLNTPSTFIDVGYYDSGQYHYHGKVGFLNLFVQDEAVAMITLVYHNRWPAGTSEPKFGKEKLTWAYQLEYYPLYTFKGVRVPCARGTTLPGYTGRAVIEVDWDSENFTILEFPSVEAVRQSDMISYLRRYYAYGAVELETELVPPPLEFNPELVRFQDNEFKLDESFAEALPDVQFTTSNGIAYALDAKDIISSAKSDLESLRSLAKGAPGKLKIAASLFLSFHYGWKLMAADTLEFSKAFRDFSKKSSRRLHFTSNGSLQGQERNGFRLISSVATRNIYYDPYAQIASETLKLARAMDATIDISNVWDMIPFSFVVDWFTNIGDLAEGIDAFFTLVQEHKVLGTITSTKDVYEYHEVGCIGTYKYTFYNRVCLKGWYPIPEFSFQIKNPITNLTHWCEAGALVVATRP